MKEAHPIPQDVTGFQFKLIGNMTIKQFLYLAAGSVVGWIFYASSPPLIIKLPFAILSFFAGFSFAFIPLEGRPMDTMFYLFIKALFAPNQYVYQKDGGTLVALPTQKISASPSAGAAASQKKTPVYQKSPDPEIITSFEAPKEIPEPKSEKLEKAATLEESLKKEAETIKNELTAAKAQEQNAVDHNAGVAVHEKVKNLEQELQETLRQKQQLEQELIALQKKLTQQKEVFTPTQAVEDKKQTNRVKTVPKTMSKTVGLIAPEAPNVLTGVVKDPRGNILPNMIVEVKTSDGDSVRAFKTNVLGQFASAMPLANGTYTIEFSDPQNMQSFDAVEIVANGEIILPLEITSVDRREELRRSLFQT